MKKLSEEKKVLIKKLRNEANKAVSKIIASTFDQNERNKGFMLINELLERKINEVVNLKN